MKYSGIAILVFALLAACSSSPRKELPPAPPVPDAKKVSAAQDTKDISVTTAATNIDGIVAKDAPQVVEPVKVQTDAIRAAVALAPAAEVAQLSRDFQNVVTALQRQIAERDAAIKKLQEQVQNLKDAEMQAQAKWLRVAGFAGLALAVGLGFAHMHAAAAAAGIIGLLALGLAQLISQHWFSVALQIAAALALVALGVAIWHSYRKGDLAKKTEREAERLRGTLSRVVPALDETYKSADATVKTAFETVILPALSRKMDEEHKQTIKDIRARV